MGRKEGRRVIRVVAALEELSDNDLANVVNPDRPLDLTTERLFCARHLGPLRADWPRGYTEAAAEVSTAALEDLGDMPIDEIESLFDHRPACERIARTRLIQAYLLSGLGSKRRCDLCRETSAGTPYTVMTPSGLRTFDHLCFSCVVYRLTPAN